MKRILSIITLTAIILQSKAQDVQVQYPELPVPVSLTTENAAYIQSFIRSETDGGLGGGNGQFNFLPSGWAFSEEGDSTRFPGIINGRYRAARGESATQDTYSFGETWANNDKALGAITGPTLYNVKKGAIFINNTGKTITELLVSYAGEQWRQGGSGIPGKLIFSYSTVATSLLSGVCLNSGVWIKVPELDFTAPQTGTEVTELNGNLPENRTVLSHKITGLSIANGTTFWLRWENDNNSGTNKEDGIAIDDVSVIPNPTQIIQHPESPVAVSLNTANVSYTQHFMRDSVNGIWGSSGQFNFVPPGWAFSEEGNPVAQPLIVNGRYRAARGESAAQDSYSFGETWANVDKAFGAITGPALPNVKKGALFTNNTGSPITELRVSYAGEQWRQGGSGIAGKLNFAYSTNATSLNTGTWTSVTALDFIAPQTGTTITELNGNLPANRDILTHTITGLNIANGASFWVRWENANASGTNKEDGIAIDDVFVTPNPLQIIQNPASPAAISLNAENETYEQTFIRSETDGLGGGAGQFDVLPSGWVFSEEGNAVAQPSVVNGTYRAARGESAAQDTYSFGILWADNDKALGSITGPNLPNVKKGALFTNNTGSTITELLITYTGEQWRQGGSGIAGKLSFAYSTNAVSLNTGTWTNVTALDFTAPHTGTTTTELNGNLAVNRTLHAHSITGLNIANGSSFWIRWENANASGTNKEDGIAIDDVSVTPNPSDDSSTTPVTLSSFTYQKKTNAVQFKWETLLERNNDYFELQRSDNGTDFSGIARIDGNGNSDVKNSYNYTDFNPLAGLSYYQLKQVDYNGESKVYPPLSVNMEEKALDFNVHSLENKNVNLRIYSPEKITPTVQITDINGREILKQKVALEKGYTDVKLNIPVSGIYVAVLSSGSYVVKKKFVIE